VSASFGSNYAEALKLLSAVLGYFQGKPMFNAQSASTFPKGLERLTMEVVNLDVQGVNNLWGNLGVKYQPSVLYKARMFTVQEAWVVEQVPPISGIDVV
jgi:Pvc16 N-terminal domain